MTLADDVTDREKYKFVEKTTNEIAIRVLVVQ
jgi:hypothetical protein